MDRIPCKTREKKSEEQIEEKRAEQWRAKTRSSGDGRASVGCNSGIKARIEEIHDRNQRSPGTVEKTKQGKEGE